jgi:hypothetical protein
MHKITRRLLPLTLSSLPLLACGGEPVAEQSSALVQTVIYQATSDTWAYGSPGAAWWDHGLSRELRTNNIDIQFQDKRILLRFPVNLALVCPTLASATLRVHTAQLAGPLLVQPHRVINPWAPGMTGNVASQGCVANSGNPAAFAMPGVAPPLPGVLVNQACTPYAFNITPIVQQWCAGAPNQGVMLAGRQDNFNGVVNFFSMEAPNGGVRPRLDITF